MGELLPVKNELGFYEMRFESVGGLGANLAGQILAQAAVLGQGLNGAHFSSYGSEKKGSPVKSFIRLSYPGLEVRTSSPVEKPHLLAVFHHCLLRVEGALFGLYPDSAVVVNSPDSPRQVRERARLASGKLGVIDALAIAVEEGTRINTAMLGAIVRLEVKAASPRQLTAMPERIAPGHGACPGCGIFPSLKQFLEGIEGHVVLLFQTGCGMVTTTGYPYSSHRVTYIHNLFQNGAATLSGLVEMVRERIRRGELADDEITFIMVSGDGGMDIGMGSAIGSALRGHPMILLEYDNQGYMNTGHQLSYATPLGHATATSHVGPHEAGKLFHHKDTAQIMAATHIPYAFTSVEGLGTDLVRKGAKAQWYARHKGFVFGKVLSVCPLSWRYDERLGTKVVKAAVDCCFFPVYEVENGITTISYDPEEQGKCIPVAQWLGMMGKSRHLLQPEHAESLQSFEKEVERRWRRLKAMHEHPLL